MTDDEAAKFRRRAIFSAARNGFSEQSEDLAHDVLVNWLEGHGQHQTVDQSVIDAIRRACGRPGTPGFECRRNVERPVDGLDALASRASPQIHPDSDADFERLIEPLESIQRAIVCLRFQWGFSEIEIGRAFGVSQSRISQRLSAALSRIESRERKQGQPREIPQELQKRPEGASQGQGGIQEMVCEQASRIPCSAGQEASEALLGTFEQDTF